MECVSLFSPATARKLKYTTVVHKPGWKPLTIGFIADLVHNTDRWLNELEQVLFQLKLPQWSAMQERWKELCI